uniref:BHLH domain-containing protein n=1 Tax=Anabas testudineus TaxID=64144 RepID=A0A3Q1HQH0_ANATE
MKMLQEPEDARKDRKFIKSQVEKRRRERMNRSLEHLRTMLLQEQQQMHRLEKAEILEQTVLFLQNTAGGDTTRAGGGVGGQKQSFQDGFSSCLQRAAQFLGREWEGQWLAAALDASFAVRFHSSDSNSAGVQKRTEACSSSSSLPHTKFLLQMLRQKSKHGQQTQASGLHSFVHPYQRPVQQQFPVVPQEHQRQNELEIRVESQEGKQSPSQSRPAGQTLWRPWP